MKIKPSIIVASVCIFATVIYFNKADRSVETKKQEEQSVKVGSFISQNVELKERKEPKKMTPTIDSPATTKLEESHQLTPQFYPHLLPLDQDEVEATKVVRQQIDEYHRWGKLDETKIDSFRELLFKYSDRMVADVARDLLSKNISDISNHEDAEKVVKDIDFLNYLSSVDKQVSHDAVRVLALRPVKWDDHRQLVDKVKANITFEAFDIFARNSPEEALAYIRKQEHFKLEAYLTRYSYGRRLAGVDNEDIDKQVHEFLLTIDFKGNQG